MLVTFKTLEHKIFKLEVDEAETVSDLKSRLEDDMGRENIYKLIYSGKILSDDNQLGDYNINPKHFVVLMITKPKPASSSLKEAVKVENVEMLPSTSFANIGENKESKQDLLKTREVKEEPEEEVEPESSSQNETEICENKEHGNTKEGLDWIEEQIMEKESHFITEREFSIALEVVMSTEYLADNGHSLSSIDHLRVLVNEFFADNHGFSEVKETVVKKMNDIYNVDPNLKQLEAFLSDICGIYSQDRKREDNAVILDLSDDEDEEEEVVLTAVDKNVDNIVAMGFIREEVIVALRAAFNNPDQAVDYLINGIPPSAFAPEDNPLAFLRGNEEFQHIRYLVQSNPAMLQSLLLSFGQKYPDLMDSINSNKGTFVRMLNEPDGAKGLGDDGGIVVDTLNNHESTESHER